MKNHEEYIRRYFNRELTETEEEIFFANIANNTTFRNDFNFYMKLNNVKDDIASAISVPAEAQAAVFSALGYSSVEAASAIAKENFLRKFFPYASTALVTAISTAVISYFVFAPSEAQISKSYQKEKSSSSMKPDNISINTEERKEKISSDKTELNNSRENFSESKNLSFGKEFSSMSIATNYNVEKENFSHSSLLQDILQVTNAPELLQSRLEKKNFSFEYAKHELTEEAKKKKYAVELKGLLPIVSIPSVDVATNSAVRNFSLTTLYKWSQDQLFGIEIGRENFHQEFETKLDGESVIVQQNPTLWTFSDVYRSEFSGLFSGFYTQVSLGLVFDGISDLVGGIGKIELGQRQNLLGEFYCNYGFNYTCLIYEREEKFASNKFGATVGVGYGF